MVIIFVLMVFVIAQFYVSQKLSGKDKALIKMESKIFALNEQLAIEKKLVLNFLQILIYSKINIMNKN